MIYDAFQYRGFGIINSLLKGKLFVAVHFLTEHMIKDCIHLS